MKEKLFCNQVAYFSKEHGGYRLRVSHEEKKKKKKSKVLLKWEEADKSVVPNHLSSLTQNCASELIATDITEAKKH